MSNLTQTLTAANRQWSSRPADERFTSLTEMQAHFERVKAQSRGVVANTRQLEVLAASDHKGLVVQGMNGHAYSPTHHAFGQLAQLARAPAGYLRTLPSELAADAMNYGLRFARDVEDVGLLLYKNGDSTLRAATGAGYGRIWNAEILAGMTRVFGDGVTGEWRVPGEFRKEIVVTKANTTLFAGDQDMFCFLADETNRIELPRRRDGQPGSMARGFFIWNSEVGAASFGISTFLYDYTCSNRMVWGASDVKELRIRHSSGAPVKYLEQIAPALHSYANSSTRSIVEGIEKAREARLGDSDDVAKFLAARKYTASTVRELQAIHSLEEGRPIETAWDAATAITARARGIEWQNERVAQERIAGDIIRKA